VETQQSVVLGAIDSSADGACSWLVNPNAFFRRSSSREMLGGDSFLSANPS
jgi:hypothetical protein